VVTALQGWPSNCYLGTVALSLKAGHLKRYKDIAFLLLKYGRSDLVKSAGLDDALGDDPRPNPGSANGNAGAELAADLERLGPTFIKLGQLLSTRPDFLPPAYIQGLAKLQDHIEPFPFDEVEAILHVELGIRISKAFSSFEAKPVGSASLGQVHRATLRDGRMVAVKIQRPGVKEKVLQDLEIFAEVAELLEKHNDTLRRHGVTDMVAEFKTSILRELDYRQEAGNLATLRENLARYRRIVVPQAIPDYSTSRVLTMEYIHGTKVTELSPIAQGEIEGPRIAEQLFHAYLKQVLVDGFFHADPHPGNIFITGDGKHVALLDLGMVARISPRMQEKLLQLLLAISEGHSDDAASIALRIGETEENFDPRTFNQRVKVLVEATQNTTVQKLEVGRLMIEVTRASGECGIRLPSELTMLGKTLLNLDEIVRKLDPAFDPNEFIRNRAPGLMRQRMKKSGSTGSIFTGLLETKDFIERLPKRLNAILDRVADNELSIKVHAIDERRLIAGLEKIANRITLGLILAALVVGAAMLMSVPTTFKILGYPGLAMIFFLTAAAGGVALAVSILMYDAKHPQN